VLNEDICKTIKDMNGYLGVGIAKYTGELIFFDESDKSINLEETAKAFNDVFRSSHALSTKLSFGQTEVMEITTATKTILMACSGEHSKLHVHMFSVFKKGGDVTLAKMLLPRVLRKAVVKLS
jgi:predicted regulator of Ras-like GTPase activity (Roadblock/LC7/MglB family)